MVLLAKKLGQFPYMEYASSYALRKFGLPMLSRLFSRVVAENWARKDISKGINFENLRLIRAFEDAEGSEKGFILVHV